MKHTQSSQRLSLARAIALCGGVAFSGAALAIDTMSTGNRGIEGGVGYSSGNASGDNAGSEQGGPKTDVSASSMGDSVRGPDTNPNAKVAPDAQVGVSGTPFESVDADDDSAVTLNEFNEFRRQYDNQGKLGMTSADWPTFAQMDQDSDGRLSEAEAGSVLK